MDVKHRIQTLGYALPTASTPAGNYVPALRVGDLVFVSGQLPLRDGRLVLTGKVGQGGHPVETAVEAARQCVLNALAAVEQLVGLDEVTGVVRAGVHVNSAPGFTQQPAVANGASDFLVEVFGDAGRHTRIAVGANELPLDAAVEIDFIFAVGGRLAARG